MKECIQTCTVCLFTMRSSRIYKLQYIHTCILICRSTQYQHCLSTVHKGRREQGVPTIKDYTPGTYICTEFSTHTVLRCLRVQCQPTVKLSQGTQKQYLLSEVLTIRVGLCTCMRSAYYPGVCTSQVCTKQVPRYK